LPSPSPLFPYTTLFRSANLTTAAVLELHAGREYLVYCIGFAPGFTYCGVLDDQLVLPRRSSPRTRVPAGSVGIAGSQTGMYAVEDRKSTRLNSSHLVIS